MKYFNKLGLFLCTAALLASCSDDNEYVAGDWDGATTEAEGFYSVAFEKKSYTVEKDPTEPTTSQIVLTRTNRVGQVEVPLEIITNTDDVFEVGKCVFEDGDTAAVVEINYPNTEIGKPYTLELQVTDKRFVSSYTDNFICELNLTRVKWNSLGIGKIEENGFWGGVSYAEYFVRDDDSSQFRIKDVFENMKVEYSYEGYDSIPINWFSNYSTAASEYIVFRVLKPGQEHAGVEISMEDLVYFNAFNTGYLNTSYGADVKLYHPSDGFTDHDKEDTWTYSKVLLWQEGNKIPAKIQFAGFYYMDGVGGWDYSDNDGMVVLTLPGYKDPYKADVTTDFDWEEIYVGEYTSTQLGGKGTSALYKGTCVTTTDDCDKVFAEEYGDAYMITSPYAEDYHLYFSVKDGQMLLPEGVELQPIGLTAMGTEVYAKINYAKSTYTDKVITLNITFTNADGTMDFGTANEELSNITYTTVGTVDYEYNIYWANSDGSPFLLSGMELQQRDDEPTTFRARGWGDMGVDFYFTWDQETNMMSVAPQAVTYNNSYGYVYISDVPTYAGYGEGYTYAEWPCVYDPATQTATLNVIYFVDAGYFGMGPEKMYIKLGVMPEEPAAAKRKAPLKDAKVVSSETKKSFGAYNPWGNVKTVKTGKNAAPQQYMLR